MDIVHKCFQPKKKGPPGFGASHNVDIITKFIFHHLMQCSYRGHMVPLNHILDLSCNQFRA